MSSFKDRKDAGKQLVDRFFLEWRSLNPVVVALPRGGVPVAFPVARRLDAPLDILVVKKIGAPSNPEFALGAVTEDGRVWINREAEEELAPTRAEMDELVSWSVGKMREQVSLLRAGRPRLDVHGRETLLIDDGLATGATLMAAIESLRSRGAASVRVAVPVASRQGLALVGTSADQVQALENPPRFHSVGEWYDDFGQTTDDEVIRILDAATPVGTGTLHREQLSLALDGVTLGGELTAPSGCRAWIIFAHGSGSSRLSPRNQSVAAELNRAGFGTLLFDLLTQEEARDRAKIFDIDLLAWRLALATRWLRSHASHESLPIAYFGASTGAAAALKAAARFEPSVFSVVSRGGRPDLAPEILGLVTCPVLLLVGGEDHAVIEFNRRASERLPRSRVQVIPGAGHLFEEEGALESVTQISRQWYISSLEKHPADNRSISPLEGG